MKRGRFACLFILLGLTQLTIAQKANFQPENKQTCPTATTRHKFSELRLRVIEVSTVDQCGLSFVDLEEKTVGPDQYLKFSSRFMVSKEKRSEKEPHESRSIEMPRKAVKRGARGLAVYCVDCQEIIGLKLF
jgi:hypothetical protein